MKILVLAGGRGHRLWPLTDPPKQFRSFENRFSLLQQTLVRFLKRYPPEDLYTITCSAYESIAKKQCAAVHPHLAKQLIIEPEQNNTAPAIAYAMDTLGDKLGERFFVVPADHFLNPVDLFLDRLAFAQAHIPERTHGLFGITPLSPKTDYGYISYRDSMVTAFHEKPSEEVASRLINTGALWNSGMILFHTETLRKSLPREVPATSIDYFLLEQADNLFVTHLDISWSDLGTWEGIYDAYPKDEQGNVLFGNVQTVGVQNCLVLGGEEPQYLSDLENSVVVFSEGQEKIVMPLCTLIPSQL